MFRCSDVGLKLCLGAGPLQCAPADRLWALLCCVADPLLLSKMLHDSMTSANAPSSQPVCNTTQSSECSAENPNWHSPEDAPKHNQEVQRLGLPQHYKQNFVPSWADLKAVGFVLDRFLAFTGLVLGISKIEAWYRGFRAFGMGELWDQDSHLCVGVGACSSVSFMLQC